MKNRTFIFSTVLISMVGNALAQPLSSVSDKTLYSDLCPESSLLARIFALSQAKPGSDECDRDLILKNVRNDLDLNYLTDGDGIVSDKKYRNQVKQSEMLLNELFDKGDSRGPNQDQRRPVPSQFYEKGPSEDRNSGMSITLPGYQTKNLSR